MEQNSREHSFCYQGKTYKGKDIIHWIEAQQNSAKPEEASLAQFLEDWFSATPYIMVQTSGSTGKAKKIRLSKEIMVQSALKTLEYFQLAPGTTVCLALPTSYIAGKMMVVRALVGKLNLTTVPLSSQPFAIPLPPFAFTALVPNQLESFLRYHQAYPHPCTVLLGGGKVSGFLMNQLQQCEARFFQSYAMTETASHVALRELTALGERAPYTALPGISFSQTADQCLIIHAPFLNHTSLVTNDVVQLISPTQFHYLGRKDNVINSGGLKLHPEILEQKLEKTLKQRFYIGKKSDQVLGEKLVLVVEEKNTQLQQQLLQTDFSKLLSKHEIPKEVLFRYPFAETPTGKIKREF